MPSKIRYICQSSRGVMSGRAALNELFRYCGDWPSDEWVRDHAKDPMWKILKDLYLEIKPPDIYFAIFRETRGINKLQSKYTTWKAFGIPAPKKAKTTPEIETLYIPIEAPALPPLPTLEVPEGWFNNAPVPPPRQPRLRRLVPNE